VLTSAVFLLQKWLVDVVKHAKLVCMRLNFELLRYELSLLPARATMIEIAQETLARHVPSLQCICIGVGRRDDGERCVWECTWWRVCGDNDASKGCHLRPANDWIATCVPRSLKSSRLWVELCRTMCSLCTVLAHCVSASCTHGAAHIPFERYTTCLLIVEPTSVGAYCDKVLYS